MLRRRKHSISIFFPCYNDSKSIGHLVRQAFKTVSKLSRDYEVIVIDDASGDNSREVLQQLAKIYRRLHLVFHAHNMGYGGTLKSGFRKASKELIFYTDGDGQYDIRELPIMVSLMSNDVDFVNGIKMTRNDPPIRIFLGNFHKFITRWFFWLTITDIDCDYRLLRRSIVKKLRLASNSGAICVELVKKAEQAGARFREVEIHHYERRWGESQFFQISKIVSTYRDLVWLWFQLMLLRKR